MILHSGVLSYRQQWTGQATGSPLAAHWNPAASSDHISPQKNVLPQKLDTKQAKKTWTHTGPSISFKQAIHTQRKKKPIQTKYVHIRCIYNAFMVIDYAGALKGWCKGPELT